MPAENRQILLAARPVGEPKPGDFRLVTAPVPQPGPGEALLRTRWLSLDPYMRGRISDAASYAAPVEIGQVIVGGTVSEVIASNLPQLAVGDRVVASAGWQDYALSDGKGLRKIAPGGAVPDSAYLGVLGIPGLTAYAGLMEIGRPQAGETLAVAAAAGPVGSAVGQIAKIEGCRTVGIAGGPDKCRHLLEELGFDAAVDHRAGDFAERLAAACPGGIDIYFENVGGAVWQAVLPLLNLGARVPVCGLVAHYNATELPPGPDRTPQLMRTVLNRRLTLRGFLVMDFAARAEAFYPQMAEWLEAGRVKYREHVIEGLENAPAGLAALLRGETFGKALVRVG